MTQMRDYRLMNNIVGWIDIFGMFTSNLIGFKKKYKFSHTITVGPHHHQTNTIEHFLITLYQLCIYLADHNKEYSNLRFDVVKSPQQDKSYPKVQQIHSSTSTDSPELSFLDFFDHVHSSFVLQLFHPSSSIAHT
ncbi:hypothetical protein C1646_663688 [Rhizophagus diaphanus]|nr:hypothetical protein C1646_663688 [Rhizophagus diaphanus] [Rhizophagus sp. MUCL 43196]